MYDASRRVTLSEHAGGAEQVTLTYNGNGSTTVGYASGTTTTHAFSTIESLPRTTGVQSAAGAESRAFYSTGHLAQRTDRNGNTTSFDANDRGLEISRTEGLGSANERTISTTWHPTLDVPTLIEEESLTTTLTYDSDGNVLTRTIIDTSLSPVEFPRFC
jgi:YD repeat-containing protein